MAAEYGYVYCLSNPYMPDLYKIGMTHKSVIARANELSSPTAVPDDFEVFFYIEVEDPRMVEASIHAELEPFRINSGREFFMWDPEEIFKIFEAWHHDGAPLAVTNSWTGFLAEKEFEKSKKNGSDDGQGKEHQASFFHK